MTDRKITGIQSITVHETTETNIMDVDLWAITDEGSEDLVEVIQMANVIEGVGFKQYARAWLVKVVHDGFTDLWDDYINDDGKGSVIPTFSILFDTIVIGAVGTMLMTFQPGKCYIFNRDDVVFELDQKRTPGAIYVLCIGTCEITHPT